VVARISQARERARVLCDPCIDSWHEIRSTIVPRDPSHWNSDPLMRALIACLIVVVCVGIAGADPAASARVVLADPDPELLHAVETALAPWKLEVVIDAVRPASTAQAEARATRLTARFVVWRRDGDLIVFDRERRAAEHREGKAGRLDAADAAAAALTVKTLMRLPSPGHHDEVTPGGPELRFQIGLASRITRGSEADVGARAGGAVLARPWHARGWRFGLAGEGGTSTAVQKSGFKGTWRDWAVLGVASWTEAIGRWEIEPLIAAGVDRSTFEGTEAGVERSEAATLALLRGGVWVRRRFDRWSLGGSLALDVAPGAPSYAKADGGKSIFEVPALAFAIGVFAAADLGR
jgi:hypothetical protein